MRPKPALALVAAWLLIAPETGADLNFQWDAPPNCPRRSDVLNRIRALAGSSLDRTEGLSAKGNIARVGGRFQLTLFVRDGTHVRRRVIASDSCADLTGAAAIALALLMGVDLGAPGEEPLSESAVDRGAEGPARDDRTRPDESSERDGDELGATSTRRWAFVLRAPTMTADVGPLPDATVGVGLGVGMLYESWRVLLAANVFRGQTIAATGPGGTFGAGADLQRMAGQLVTCRGWRSVQFEIAPCLGLGLEYLTARGVGQGVSPESRRAIWPAPSAGATGYWYAFENMSLFAGLTGYLELSRPRLVIEGLGEIRKLAPIAAGATVGVEWIL